MSRLAIRLYECNRTIIATYVHKLVPRVTAGANEVAALFVYLGLRGAKHNHESTVYACPHGFLPRRETIVAPFSLERQT